MKRSLRRAAGGVTTALALAVFSGTALAGGGNGGDHGNGGGGSWSQQSSQQKHDDHSQQSPSGDQSPPASHETAQDSASPSGVKPDNTTSHWTKTRVGDKPDVSKRYGNGKTASEIAKSHGAPDSTVLSGPGNSQPHKVLSCKHRHAVDVHAVKSYSSGDCSKGTSESDVKAVEVEQHASVKAEQHTVKVFTKEDHKVTLCHLTGNGSYVLITVDKHSLKHGHTTEKGDIIPAPAAGCPAATGFVAGVQTTQVESCGSTKAKHDDDEKDEHGGQKGEHTGDHQDSNGEKSSSGHDDDECTTPAAVATTPATTTTVTTSTMTTEAAVVVAATTTETVATTPVTTTTAVAAGGVAGTTAAVTTPAVETQSAASAPQGGVLGANTTLNAPKPQRGGVLGAVTNVAGSTLPFTGFPLWIAVLLAVVLIAAGLMLRGRGTASRL
jgi:hypothetical protein